MQIILILLMLWFESRRSLQIRPCSSVVSSIRLIIGRSLVRIQSGAPTSEVNMRIVDVDYWEHDALLKVDNKAYYFQFDVEPTLESALKFFRKENKGDIVQLIEQFLHTEKVGGLIPPVTTKLEH